MIDFDLVDHLAETLGETDPLPLAQIRRIVAMIGPERAQAFVDQALVVQANGGMLLPDGSRRRTLGGVFFALVREGVSEAEQQTIFPPRNQRRQKQHSKGGVQQPTHEQPKLMKISQFWLDLAAGKPLGPRWSR